MKKLFHTILYSALVLCTTLSCTNDPATPDIIWDITPLVISLKVLDTQGHTTLNAINTMHISATFQGKTYTCQKYTRFIMPQFYGLAYANDYLFFGELNGEQTYTDEQLILHWGGNNKDDTICFNHQLIWKDGTPQRSITFRLNGQEAEAPITLYKDLSTQSDASPIDTTRLKSLKPYIPFVNKFSLNLFNEMLAANNTNYSNEVTSPLNVALNLGMLLGGSSPGSTTWRELYDAFSNISDNILIDNIDNYPHSLFQQLISYATLVDPAVNLYLANALFVHNDYNIYAGYANFLAQYYQADYEYLDFYSQDAVYRMNEWSKQKTKGLIPTIAYQHQMIQSPPALAYLASAACFKGGWTYPFDIKNTHDEEFTRSDGTQQQLPMMHQTLCARYVHLPSFDAVCLPFANQFYEMMVILPQKGQTPKDILTMLAASSDLDLHKLPWQLGHVEVTLPRFRIETQHNLHELLTSLGIKKVFTQEAELTEASPESGLHISQMVQNVQINIDEKGCEGGSFTIDKEANQAFDIFLDNDNITSSSFVFNANHPFVYLIRERSTNAIIFLGAF